jgi:hypothetical protein
MMWQIDDSEFFELETIDAQLRFLLRFAVLAPSGHNTQPWAFWVRNNRIDVYADYSRRMPHVDPHDGELLMSVGAAIMNFRVAAAHFGFDVHVTYSTDGGEREPVAHIAISHTIGHDDELSSLFGAIRERHTNRAAFDEQPLASEAMAVVSTLVQRFPETLHLIWPADQDRAASLIEYASRRQLSDGAARAELAGWVRPGASDGLTGEAAGLPSLLAGSASWLLRHLDVGAVKGPHDRKQAGAAAALVVVTSEDDRVALVQAGEILEELLLAITAAGLHYSFFNQPIEIEGLRDRVQLLASSRRKPQVLLRLGHAHSAAAPTHRRPMKEVLA